MIGIGRLSAGSAWNIIPQSAVIEGTIRALSNETEELLAHKIQETASDTAAFYGVRALTEVERCTPALINSDEAYEEVCRAAGKLVGKENVIADQTLLMGFSADDFAEFIQEEKGAYAHVGVANDTPSSRVSLHSEFLEPDEGALAVAAGLHVEYALSILKSGR